MADRKKQIRDSAEWFEDFTGHEAEQTESINFVTPKAVGVIGRVYAIAYEAKRGNKTDVYEHKFKASNAPILAVSSDGRQLMILGGNYKVTDHGIED